MIRSKLENLGITGICGDNDNNRQSDQVDSKIHNH